MDYQQQLLEDLGQRCLNHDHRVKSHWWDRFTLISQAWISSSFDLPLYHVTLFPKFGEKKITELQQLSIYIMYGVTKKAPNFITASHEGGRTQDGDGQASPRWWSGATYPFLPQPPLCNWSTSGRKLALQALADLRLYLLFLSSTLFCKTAT